MSAAERYPSYRAPRANREVLCVPAWESLPNRLADAREPLDASNVTIMGFRLPELAQAARREVVVAARDYVQTYLSSMGEVSDDGPLIVTGHQPELVHPGVWLKNFAAAKLAQSVGGAAINLIIDNDLCRKPSIRVPTGTADEPQVVDVAFDAAQAEMPYEERKICDAEVWRSFPERVSGALSSLVPDAIVAKVWPGNPETTNLGQAIAQARHRCETEWGSQTLELPQSTVCQTKSFQQFALHLLGHAAQVRSEYNSALAEYRQQHRLRSAAQPLPDLQELDGWLETPFWVWAEDSSTRRALFVRPSRDELTFTDRHDWQATLPLSDANDGVEQLRQWEEAGIKIRTRALITTLYARLLLADTFIHGIGGAKYDEVTDRLCERLFGISLPPFVVLSGTLKLPIEHAEVPSESVSALRHRLRELRYHPEVHLDMESHLPIEREKIKELIGQKARWVQTPKTPQNASHRHEKINEANEKLQMWLNTERENVRRELNCLVSQTRTNRLLESREYPFCLFPPKVLQSFLLDF